MRQTVECHLETGLTEAVSNVLDGFSAACISFGDFQVPPPNRSHALSNIPLDHITGVHHIRFVARLVAVQGDAAGDVSRARDANPTGHFSSFATASSSAT